MRTNMSPDSKLRQEVIIERDSKLGIKYWHQHRYHLGHQLWRHPLSPWNELEANRVTQALNTPHPSDSRVPDPELDKTPTSDEVKDMVQKLPSDKAAGPDGITNRILQGGGNSCWHDLPVHAYHLASGKLLWSMGLGSHATHIQKKRQTFPNFVTRHLSTKHPNQTLQRPHRITSLQIRWTQWHPHTLTTRLATHPPNTRRYLCTHNHNITRIPIWICQLLLFFYFATAYFSVHSKRLGPTLNSYIITWKIWQLSAK